MARTLGQSKDSGKHNPQKKTRISPVNERNWPFFSDGIDVTTGREEAAMGGGSKARHDEEAASDDPSEPIFGIVS